MTKTLKQLIKDQYNNEEQWFTHHDLLCEKIMINAFKEWLTQKRQEWEKENRKLWIRAIDELLEELQQ